MAKSLLCKDCNLLLKSIAEAQSHNEVTGHSNFEETTIAVSDTLLYIYLLLEGRVIASTR